MQWQSHLLAGAFATLLVLATLPDTGIIFAVNQEASNSTSKVSFVGNLSDPGWEMVVESSARIEETVLRYLQPVMALRKLLCTDAECCNRGSIRKVLKEVPGRGWIDTYQRLCGDCTVSHSTFCGHGPCNIFGCNCKCRRGDCDNVRRRRDVAYSGEAIMNAGDVNGDGNFSLYEAEVFLSKKGTVVNKRAVRSLDVNDDGSLTADEIEFPVTGNGQ